MSRRILRQIRTAIRAGNYDMTHHAVEEMVDDELCLSDIEQAVFNGELASIDENDLRGVKDTIIGWSDEVDTPIGIVGRFKETQVYLIITVYAVTD